jgi:biopolymer transport protein ExbB
MKVVKWGTLVVLMTAGAMAVAHGAEGGIDPSQQDPNAGIFTRIAGGIGSLYQLHVAGGYVMWAIDLCLLISVAFIIERIVRLRRATTVPTQLLQEVEEPLQRGDMQTVREISEQHENSILGKVLLYLTENPDAPKDEREETANAIASRHLDMHRMMGVPLAAITGIAPLIGLLGTVMGIRSSFGAVAAAGAVGDPTILAGGIEQALVTTIYGLVVAIPALAAYNLFRLRVNLIGNQLEEVLHMLMRQSNFTGRADRSQATDETQQDADTAVAEEPAGA